MERARALEAAGGLAYWQADLAVAQRFYDESLALTRQGHDTGAIANAIYNAAFPKFLGRTDIPGARVLFREALPLFRQISDEPGVAKTLWGLGNCEYYADDLAAAAPLLEEAESLLRKLDDRFGLGWALHTRGLVAIKQRDIVQARRRVGEALEIFTTAHDVSGIVFQLDNASAITRLGGNPVSASRLAAAATRHRESSGAGLGQLLSEHEGRTGREGLTTAEAERAWQEGLSMSLEEAVAAARLGLQG